MKLFVHVLWGLVHLYNYMRYGKIFLWHFWSQGVIYFLNFMVYDPFDVTPRSQYELLLSFFTYKLINWLVIFLESYTQTMKILQNLLLDPHRIILLPLSQFHGHSFLWGCPNRNQSNKFATFQAINVFEGKKKCWQIRKECYWIRIQTHELHACPL